MKTFMSQLAYVLGEEGMRQNVQVLLRFLLFGVAVVLLYAGIFQVLMTHVEGQEHGFLAGLYWTVVTMTTLGYGDIVFVTGLGRAFSIFVLVSGVVLFLVVLPFIFIRYFYAPWLEAQVRLRAPTRARSGTRDHVIVCREDTIAPGLMRQLDVERIPYVLLESDPERAAVLDSRGYHVVTGPVDAVETYERARVAEARLVFANYEDVDNANIVLTAREVAPLVPTAAIISDDDSQDILELAGCDHILPLRRQLGVQLASRVNTGHAQTHEVGRFHGVILAEFPVLNTPFAGKTIRDLSLRDNFGVNIVGIWESAEFLPPDPDYQLTDLSLPLVVGREEQIQALDELLYIYDTNWNPVVVIGGGKVGRAAARAFQDREVPVHLIERKPEIALKAEAVADQVFVGDAANRELLEKSGLDEAPAVLLTTNDDATNVYLAAYCRGLRKDLRIVSRITHERNMQSIRRAGADLALSYAHLGVESVLAISHGRELMLLGTGVDFLEIPVPQSLAGKTLSESEVGARTGLNVVALETDGEFVSNPDPGQVIPKEALLHVIGTEEQVQAFEEAFG